METIICEIFHMQFKTHFLFCTNHASPGDCSMNLPGRERIFPEVEILRLKIF